MMYTNENLSLILAKLSSLTPWELELVKFQVNSIIRQKKQNNLIHPYQLQYNSDLESLLKIDVDAVSVVAGNLPSICFQQIKSLQSSSNNETLENALNRLGTSVLQIGMLEALNKESELKASEPIKTGLKHYANHNESNNESRENTPVKKSPRPLGVWKGKVEISEDFYKTSGDILSDFGIEE